MKNKFIVLFSEAIFINLIVGFSIWKFNIVPEINSTTGQVLLGNIGGSMILIAVIYIAIMVLIGIQGYFYIIKPYSLKIKEMERMMEEGRKLEAMRRDFVANVSHELKTPLTSISGFIETLQDGAAEDPEIRTKFIDIIAIETSRLKRLIQDLLVLSDIENKNVVEDVSFNVKTAIEDTVQTLNVIAADKNIKILTELDENINIKGSIDRFRQMMVNLIENGIKYSDNGSRIWIKAFEEEGKNIISVKDEGIGIAPEHHERLFERFYRVDKSRSKKAGGTGLGLSIVKHIAVLLNASLKVESQVGKGTTFFVIFKKEEAAEN